jgi:hypothetical protein
VSQLHQSELVTWRCVAPKLVSCIVCPIDLRQVRSKSTQNFNHMEREIQLLKL